MSSGEEITEPEIFLVDLVSNLQYTGRGTGAFVRSHLRLRPYLCRRSHLRQRPCQSRLLRLLGLRGATGVLAPSRHTVMITSEDDVHDWEESMRQQLLHELREGQSPTCGTLSGGPSGMDQSRRPGD